MGLSWQQGPLSEGAIGRFLVAESLPTRLLYAERLRRRMRVRFAGIWIADSEDVLLLVEPGGYPVAYCPESDLSPNTPPHPEATTRNTPPSTKTLGRHPGTPSGPANRARREARGSTATCPPTRASCGAGSRSPGGPWTPFMKRTNGSSGTPRTAITASTSGRLLV